MSETEKQKTCRYCHGNAPKQIMDVDNGDLVDVWVLGHTLMVEEIDMPGVYIGYCPMCGRKLGD